LFTVTKVVLAAYDSCGAMADYTQLRYQAALRGKVGNESETETETERQTEREREREREREKDRERQEHRP
jgi:hypothetical protein